jgi:hypothetical protein
LLQSACLDNCIKRCTLVPVVHSFSCGRHLSKRAPHKGPSRTGLPELHAPADGVSRDGRCLPVLQDHTETRTRLARLRIGIPAAKAVESGERHLQTQEFRSSLQGALARARRGRRTLT